MHRRLAAYISAGRLFGSQHRLLLAVSGGPDSVVMATLIHRLGYNMAIAHCNYKLRGADSERDETFCREFAKTLDCPFYSKTMRLSARRSDQSLQEEARTGRYEWLDELRRKEGFDFVLTAHHADDQAETLLLNLMRGTGLRGLRGIARKENHMVRPMLGFSREEILEFAKKNRTRYRKDRSNDSLKYRRNYVRHKVIPVLEKLNPSVSRTLAENASRFSGEYKMLENALREACGRITDRRSREIRISITGLRREPSPEAVLHYMLAPFDFNADQVEQVMQTIMPEPLPGKRFFSATHRLATGRDHLTVTPMGNPGNGVTVISSMKELSRVPGLNVSRTSSAGATPPDRLILDPRQLVWPLAIRQPKKGDRMHPFGMNGTKLISDLLREKKLDLPAKENARVLVNGNGEIIWLMGVRSDERYRVAPGKKSLIALSLHEQG